MDKAVFGIYKIRREAENAVNALRTNGFRTENISVLLPENMGSQDQFHIKVSKTPDDAVAGASAGAVLGGTLSLLASIGTLTIPGVGPFIAAGPLLAALAGIGAGGAAGALVGVLAGYGIPKTEAEKFEDFMREGRVLVFVNADDEEAAVKAKNILEATGALEASVSSELGEDWIPAKNKTGSQATTRFF